MLLHKKDFLYLFARCTGGANLLASDLQLAGSLTASVAMLASELQLAGSLPASVAMLAICSSYFDKEISRYHFLISFGFMHC